LHNYLIPEIDVYLEVITQNKKTILIIQLFLKHLKNRQRTFKLTRKPCLFLGKFKVNVNECDGQVAYLKKLSTL